MSVLSLILVAGAQFGASLPTSLLSSTARVVVEKVMEADSSSNHSKLLMEQPRVPAVFNEVWILQRLHHRPIGLALPEDLSVVPQEAGTRPTMRQLSKEHIW